MVQEAEKPCLVHRVEEASDIGIQYVVHFRAGDSDGERIQRIMLATSRAEPVREPEEILLVDRVQHRGRRPLDDLVLEGGHRKRALSAIRLRDVLPPGWLRPIRSPMNPVVQIHEPRLEIGLVVLPCQAVDAGRRAALECEERHPEQIDAEMVEEGGEPLLPPLPCGLPYALQRLGHASPVLRPARALLARVPLGTRPSPHRLRARSLATGVVRRLRRYYGGV